MGRVILLGGTGEMGRRLERLLREARPQIEIVIASRTGPVRADVTVPETVAGLLQPGDVLIDAVGPYRHDPSVWVRSGLRAGAHVIDLSEGPAFQRVARAACPPDPRGALVTGCSTIPALVEALWPALGEPQAGDRYRVLLSMGSANPVSPGLIFSLLRPFGRPISAARGRTFRRRATKRLADGRFTAFGAYPATWDEEPPPHPAAFYAGFDRPILYWPLWVSSFFLPHFSDGLLWTGCRVLTPLLRLWRPFGTYKGALTLERWDSRGDIVAELQVHAARQGLDIPAYPAVWATLALLDGADRRGVTTLADLLGPEEILARLGSIGDHIRVVPSLHG
jgi:hypothetical protein